MKQCARPSCERVISRNAPDDYLFCCPACRFVQSEFDAAMRIAAVVGGDAGQELRDLASRLSDVLSDFKRRETSVYKAAMASGFSTQQWRAIREGRPV